MCVCVQRCIRPHIRGWYVQSSMELGPEDVSLLERCPHFRGCYYVQSSMELGPEDVSPIREVSSLTLGAHAQEGYGTCPVCVCSSANNARFYAQNEVRRGLS